MHKHHAELRNVWGDLEENISVLIPQQAEQPENMKVTLLPFQRESLYWMRKQENGVWSGGMLAVRFQSLSFNSYNILPFAVQDEMGCVLSNLSSTSITDLVNRMGKTIQMISLFVTDGAGPNLVVA